MLMLAAEHVNPSTTVTFKLPDRFSTRHRIGPLANVDILPAEEKNSIMFLNFLKSDDITTKARELRRPNQ